MINFKRYINWDSFAITSIIASIIVLIFKSSNIIAVAFFYLDILFNITRPDISVGKMINPSITCIKLHHPDSIDKTKLIEAIILKDGNGDVVSIKNSIFDIHKKIKENAMIDKVSIKRTFGKCLEVSATKIDAIAYYQDGDMVKIVTSQKILEIEKSIIQKYDAPIIDSIDRIDDVRNLISILKANGIYNIVSKIQNISGVRWDLVLKNSVVVKLPVNEYDLAVARLASIKERLSLTNEISDIIYIDTRVPSRIYVKYAHDI
jgi:cell division protein FtsQ